MKTKIHAQTALKILDSRGFPAVRANVLLDDGMLATASVLSGGSTGENEATELRDGAPLHFGGKGVLKTVQNGNTEIASAVTGLDAREQTSIDPLMIDLDGTPSKSRLGANAILGVSRLQPVW